MNEFSAKKIGEVLAFSTAGIEIIQKANLFTEKTAELEENRSKIIHCAKKHKGYEVAKTKSEKTYDKLMRMAEMYVGDEWDNPAEVMEWLGFFLGAAIIHWKLVEGISRELQDEELTSLVNKSLAMYRGFFDQVATKISQ